MKSTLARTALMLAVPASLVCLASFPATAGAQLIHMTNGKVVRAEGVEPDGEWLMVTLHGGGVVGVLAHTVERVEEDLLPGSEELGSELNVVTSGRYVPRGRRSSARSRSSRRSTPRASQQQADTKTQQKAAKPGVRSQGGLRIQGQQQPTATQSRSNSERRRNR